MNKILLTLILMLLLFTSCDDTKNTGNQNSVNTPDALISTQDSDKPFRLDYNDISNVKIKDIKTEQETNLIYQGLVEEFCSFIINLDYSDPNSNWDMYYQAELFNRDGESVLEVDFGERAVSFGKSVELGDTVIEKGTYEVEKWISEHTSKFFEGMVLDPVHVNYPAKITVTEEASRVELINKGSNKVNQYEAYPQLYTFLEFYFLGKTFEIVESKRVIDYESMEQLRLDVMNNNKSMVVDFAYSMNYLEIDTASKYGEFSKAGVITLAKQPEKPGIYRLLTDNMIIDIKVSDDFDRKFESVFNAMGNVARDLTPDEIETLFNEKKPHYLKYICQNLGIEDWYGREPRRLERFKMSLYNSSEYTVLGLNNDFDLRLLFFKENRNNEWNFIDFIDFGGRMAGTEYRLEKAGDKEFIVGKTCKGYGTGEARYYEDWYLLGGQGKKLVLSIPSEEYIAPPFGGYTIKANSIKLNTKGNINVSADYDITRNYLLDLDIDDEYGQVSIEGKKKVVFKWDDEKSVFVSEYAPDETGKTEVPARFGDLADKCTDILKENYQKLVNSLESLDAEENEYMRDSKARALENFLNDCKDCEEKAALLEMMKG